MSFCNYRRIFFDVIIINRLHCIVAYYVNCVSFHTFSIVLLVVYFLMHSIIHETESKIVQSKVAHRKLEN